MLLVIVGLIIPNLRRLRRVDGVPRRIVMSSVELTKCLGRTGLLVGSICAVLSMISRFAVLFEISGIPDQFILYIYILVPPLTLAGIGAATGLLAYLEAMFFHILISRRLDQGPVEVLDPVE